MTSCLQARALDVLAGGCVCCDRQEEMKALSHRVCNDRGRKQSAPQSQDLIFEMSGVADPGRVLAQVQDDPILARHIALKEIVVLVYALHGRDQLQDEALARAQIEAADRIVIAKTVNCKPDDLAQLVATLRRINPPPDIRTSEFGIEGSLPELPDVAPVDLPNFEEAADRAPIVSLPLDLPEFCKGNDVWVPCSIWLSAMLHTHGSNLVRVKGVMMTPSGRLLLQSVRKIMQTPERIPADHGTDGTDARKTDDTVVLIGRGLNEDRIKASLQKTIEIAQSDDKADAL